MDAEKRARLDRGLSPKVVAVVGAKKAANYSWLRSVRDLKGKVYSVQIDQNEIPGILELGFTNVASMKDIPEDVDYVICAVPRNVSPYVVRDAIAKRVGAITLFTSGFSETQTEDGRKMQETITNLAREGDLNLVGPNCMGVYNPSVGLRFGADQPIAPENIGPVAFIAQSGSQSGGLISEAVANGIGMSKVISFGNGVVLHAPDYLEYFLDDPATKYVGCYLEGISDGRRFFEVLRQVAPVKPVVIWKGGITPDSSRATQSHTGSLAVDNVIWDTMVRQAGAIGVHGAEETVDVLKALMTTQPFTGKRLGVVATFGGHSVESADIFSREGSRIPALTQESYDILAPWFNVVGGSFRNPLEGGGNLGSEENYTKILDVLDNDENVDAIVVEISGGFGGGANISADESLMRRADTLVEWRKTSRKPLWAVHSSQSRASGDTVKTVNLRLQAGKIPAYYTLSRAARALAKFRAYSEQLLGEN